MFSVEKLASAVTASVLVAVIAISAFLSADSTVLYPRESGDGDPLRRYLLPVFPQSWPFFTKPPTDSEFSAYAVNGATVSRATDFPNSLPSNGFGFARSQRSQGPELANLAAQIPTNSWLDCVTVPGDCVLAADENAAVQVTNSSTLPALCGNLVLSETEPVEWSFRHTYDGWRIDLRTVKVEVDCG